MRRVLVVDDEEAVRSAVKRRLVREGYEVDLAGSQAEVALRIYGARGRDDVPSADALSPPVRIHARRLIKEALRELAPLASELGVVLAVEPVLKLKSRS